MSQFAEQLAENHAQAAAAQMHSRNGRRVIRRDLATPIVKIGSTDEIATDHGTTEIVMPAVTEPPALPAPAPAHALITTSPLDLPAEQFRSGLDRRKQNRQLLMEWIRSSLVDGVDFGRVHIASKERCDLAKQGRVRECSNPYHWSKPSLFKPGAEKITGMLGMTVHYPSLPALEQAVLAGTQLTQIMLRCELHDARGSVVAEGVGARSLAQDYGDINKALKMAEKSAHIDATLRLAGLSEVFTQDLEDRPAGEEIEVEPPARVVRGNAGKSSPAKSASADNGFSETSQKPPSTGTLKPPAPPTTDLDTEIIAADDVEIVRNRIAEVGISEKRVLACLYKVTKGTVTRFDQLNVAQCTSLLKRLDIWAQEMASQPTH